MEIFLIILGVFLLLCLLSIGGWILKLLGHIVSLFFEGIGNCLGCLLNSAFWIFIIFLLLLVLAA